jgi:hypothetical protein
LEWEEPCINLDSLKNYKFILRAVNLWMTQIRNQI